MTVVLITACLCFFTTCSCIIRIWGQLLKQADQFKTNRGISGIYCHGKMWRQTANNIISNGWLVYKSMPEQLEKDFTHIFYNSFWISKWRLSNVNVLLSLRDTILGWWTVALSQQDSNVPPLKKDTAFSFKSIEPHLLNCKVV